MKVAERDELLVRVDERVDGLGNDVKEIKEALKEQNGRQRKTDKKLNTTIGILIGLGVLGGGGVGIAQLIGG